MCTFTLGEMILPIPKNTNTLCFRPPPIPIPRGNSPSCFQIARDHQKASLRRGADREIRHFWRRARFGARPDSHPRPGKPQSGGLSNVRHPVHTAATMFKEDAVQLRAAPVFCSTWCNDSWADQFANWPQNALTGAAGCCTVACLRMLVGWLINALELLQLLRQYPALFEVQQLVLWQSSRPC